MGSVAVLLVCGCHVDVPSIVESVELGGPEVGGVVCVGRWVPGRMSASCVIDHIPITREREYYFNIPNRTLLELPFIIEVRDAARLPKRHTISCREREVELVVVIRNEWIRRRLRCDS